MQNTRLLEDFFKQGEPTKENPKPNDSYALESLLGQLHARRYNGTEEREPGVWLWNEQGIDLLQALIQHPWRHIESETSADIFARIKSSPEFTASLAYQEINAIRKSYEQAADAKTPTWPYDWREKEAVWLSLLETNLMARESNQPAQVFRDRLPKDPNDAQWYRLAYLRLVRQNPKGSFDFELVRPLLDVESEQVLRNRICDVLSAMPKRPENETQRELSESLQSQLTTLLDGEKKDIPAAYQLGLSLRSSREWPPAAVNWIQQSASADAAHYFVQAADVSKETGLRLLLGRHVNVKFRELPLGKVMREMCSLIHYPIWIDERVYADQQMVNFTAQGPWLEILDRILETSDYRASLLWSRILWVGPQSDRQKMEQIISRVPQVSEKVRTALLLTYNCEFVETPVGDVIEYLKDVSEVEIFCIEPSRRSIPVSLVERNLPLLAQLSKAAKVANWDWLATDELIVIGSPEKLAEYQRDADRQLRRVTIRGDKLQDTFSEPVSVEFVETPLQDVAKYMSDDYQLKILVLGAKNKPITTNLKNMSLSTVLSMVTIAHDLAWDCNGESILIGEPYQVEGYLRGVAERAAREASIPQDAREKLAQVLTLEFTNTPLKEVLASLADSTTIPIVPGKKLDLRQPITMNDQNYSLEMLLDFMAARHTLIWEYRAGKIEISLP